MPEKYSVILCCACCLLLLSACGHRSISSDRVVTPRRSIPLSEDEILLNRFRSARLEVDKICEDFEHLLVEIEMAKDARSSMALIKELIVFLRDGTLSVGADMTREEIERRIAKQFAPESIVLVRRYHLYSGLVDIFCRIALVYSESESLASRYKEQRVLRRALRVSTTKIMPMLARNKLILIQEKFNIERGQQKEEDLSQEVKDITSLTESHVKRDKYIERAIR